MSEPFKLNEFDRGLLAGFARPVTFEALRAAEEGGPEAEAGVYAVIYPFHHGPEFVAVGSGGSHKGKDPNVAREELLERWVADSRLLYFGKAGGTDKKTQLRKRISAFSRFGAGGKAGHWGGRLIWQIGGAQNLLVSWKATPGEEPRAVEHRLIRQFVGHYCKLPFANLAD